MSGASYSSAGVDLVAYREAMARLPAHMRRTHCPRVMGREGSFAALFQLDLVFKLLGLEITQLRRHVDIAIGIRIALNNPF